jgi:hypothetical protein
VIADAGDLEDHIRDPRQCPQLVLVAPDPRSLDQRLMNLLALRVGEPRLATGTPSPKKARFTFLEPRAIPAHRRGPAHAQLARDLGLSRAL